MTETPVELIVAAFQDEKKAEAVLAELKEAKHEGLIAIQDAAVIRRDQKNKIHIKDVHDIGKRGGTVLGAVVGTGIALMTGGAGIILYGAAGALVGRLAAKKIDLGIDDKRLKEIADALQPGSSAIIAVIENKAVAQMEESLAEAGAEVMKEALKADIAAQLEAGKDVSYSMIADDEGTSVERVTGDEHELEVESLVISEEGIAGAATIVTEDGVLSRELMITDGELAFGEIAATEDVVYAESVVSTEEGVVIEKAAILLEDEEETERNKDT